LPRYIYFLAKNLFFVCSFKCKRAVSAVSAVSAVNQTKNGLVRQLQPYKALMDLEGVAEVCASMLYSSIGDGKQFKSGREASDFIGLTPKQHSSGGKVFMTGIDRAGGIKELRSALYQGALS
jgi:transposase